MKTNEIKYDVESSGIESKQFSIALTSHTFDILSKNIYSDVPRAIVRELLCNGIDACIKAKVEEPVEIYLPTYDVPNLEIVDHGIGMSKREVEQIYTTYFSSTKQDNNEETGMLGLGCKTPFAYADQYTVETTKNKKTNTFLIFRNSKGIPEVSHVGTSDGKDSGTKIVIPIQSSDFKKFYKATFVTLPFLHHDPIVMRGEREMLDEFMNLKYSSYSDQSKEKFLKTMKSFKNDRVFIKDSSTYEYSIFKSVSNGSHLGIEMGGVFYYVDEAKLDLLKGVSRYPISEHTVDSAKIIKVPIGSVDIQPSREALNYSEKTIKFLKEEFSKSFNEDLNHLLSMTDENFKDVAKKFKNPRSLVEIIDNDKLTLDNRSDINVKYAELSKTIDWNNWTIYRVSGLNQKNPNIHWLNDSKFSGEKLNNGNNQTKLGKEIFTEVLNYNYIKDVVVMNDKAYETIASRHQDNIFKLPAGIKNKLEIKFTESGESVFLVPQIGLNWFKTYMPDIEVTFFEELKNQKEKERTQRTGSINRTDKSGEPDLWDVDSMTEVTLEELQEDIKSGLIKGVTYEVFSGTIDKSSNASCWNEYINIPRLQKGGDFLKKEVSTIVRTSKGFNPIWDELKHIESNIKVSKIGIDFLEEEVPMRHIIVRYLTFIKLQLHEIPGFVQASDYYAERYLDFISKAEKNVENVKLFPKLFWDKYHASVLEGVAQKYFPKYQTSKFKEEIDISLDIYQNHMTDMEIRVLKDNVRYSFQSISYTGLFPKAMGIGLDERINKMLEEYQNLSKKTTEEYLNRQDSFYEAYPLLKRIQFTGDEDESLLKEIMIYMEAKS